ncbi:hypothetical protein OSB04_021202 [Centaurea solstitialis]|uniref:SWIM-type domain-containing protein n=1 Tax=Centaurea solstitialis TaxID=347529 RepID=A0AA38WG08_9ASTR|nr:hypothetical protein OSB04_021202 [Centaurea solstitialis]
MSCDDEKANVYLRSGGFWAEGVEGWDYVVSEETVTKGVRLKLNTTYKELVRYCCRKCEIDRSNGVMNMAYKFQRQIFQVTDDEDVTAFLQFAKQSTKAPILYVDAFLDGGGDGSGTSNAVNEEPMYSDQVYTESQIQQSYDTSYTEVVPETQHQQQEGQEEEDEEEYERRKFAGCAEDESHVYHTGLTDEEEDEENEEEDEENEEGVEPFKLREGVNDYFGMPPLLRSEDFFSQNNEVVPYRRSQRVKDGQVFDTKEQMILAVGQKFLEEGFEHKTNRSCTQRYEVVCVRDKCNWLMKARSVGETGAFMVRTLVDKHTCSRTQLNPGHRQANKKILGNLFKNKFINVKRALTPKDMVQDVQEMYGFEISYATAWRARWKALELIRGSHAESFTRLPTYLYNLKRVNPGTRTAIRTDSSGRFAECFVALGVSIQTFLENLRPILIIDAAHLKGAYLGTMFLVVAMDGNNNIVPVAFGVGRSETADEWTWFLNMLKGCIGEPRGLVFMSDRAASINAAISAIFPGAHHALCCRHLVMNVRSRDPRIKVYRIAYWKACKAYTTRVFDRMMNILQVGVPEGAKLMEEVGVDRWSRAYFPAKRFNIMTSNSAESINAMSRFARRLPIVGLIEYFREFQQEWYFLRRNKVAELNHPLTEWAQLKIQKRIGKSAMWTVRGIGYGRWQVLDMDRGAEVDMTIRSCSCLKWQVSGLPCGHAIAVAKKLGEKDCFHLITEPYFMSELYKATYKGVINPVGPSQTWEYPEDPLPIVHPPLVIKRAAGRPKGNNRRPSRGESRTQKRCPRCEEYGHTSTQCPLIPSSARGSSQLEPIGTIDLNSLYQNVQFN